MTSKFRVILGICMIVAMMSIGSLAIFTANAQSTSDGCPTANFIDVSISTLQSNYTQPTLGVNCDDNAIYVQSNGMIHYEFVAITPFDLTEQNYNWQIPRNPQMANSPSDIPLLGPVAMAINGVPFFGPNENPRDDYGDPVLDNLLDFCNGHTAQGMYHYHARPNCLYSNDASSVGVVLGYSFDGYPILSPYVCDNADCTSISKMQSSWQRTQDVRNAWEAHEYIAGSGDLDQCNGTTLADGSYAYFATDTFPYIMGCYVGVAELNANSAIPGGGQGGQNGQAPQGQNQQAQGQQPTGNMPQGQNGDGQFQGPPNGGNGQRPQGPPPNGGNGQRPRGSRGGNGGG